MTKPKAESHAPSYSCRIWHDRNAIYVELASGLITKFDKTEGALSKVLKLLERESRNAGPLANGKSKARLPIQPKPAKPLVSNEERDEAFDILKKKGLL